MAVNAHLGVVFSCCTKMLPLFPSSGRAVLQNAIQLFLLRLHSDFIRRYAVILSDGNLCVFVRRGLFVVAVSCGKVS